MLHQVGAGTLGPVFRAYDPPEGRLVAIKAFRLDLLPERMAAFAAALDALAGRSLDHPSIATPLAAGIEGHTAWFAQAYVPAESLDAALRQYGPPPLADALAILTQLAGALDFAAAAGVMHGALHPRDVLVAPDDTRVVDLGVAAALEHVGLRAPVRRPYTAPERIAGGGVTRAADVFSLGAIAFELVSGARVTGAGDEAVAALREIPGASRDALTDAFAFALSPAPDERFTTALGFVAALKRALGDAPLRPVVVAAPAPAADLPEPARVEPAPASPAPDPPPAVLEHEAEPREGPSALAAGTPATAAAGSPTPQRPKPRSPRPRPVPPLVMLEPPEGPAAPPAMPEPAEAPAAPAATPEASDASDGDEGGNAAPPPASLHELEFRPPPPAPDTEWDAPVPEERRVADDPSAGFVPGPPAYAPRVRGIAWNTVAAIFVVGAVAGLALGWVFFARGGRSSASSHARDTGPAQGASAPRSAEPIAGPAASGPTASPTAEPRVSGPSAPASGLAAAAGRAPVPAAEKAPAPPPAKEKPRPAVVRGQLVVRSKPSGARLEVNGRDRGRTPVTVRDLPLGAVTLKLTRDGYTAEQRRVTLTSARSSQTLDVPMTKAPAKAAAPAKSPTARASSEFVGTVFVETRPAGARVFIDGRDVGVSPVDVPDVSAGSHAVRLELKGFKRWSAAVTVVAGERHRVAASLEEEEVR